MLSLLFLNLGQVAKPALNTKGTQAETTVFKGKTKTTERVNVSLPGPMPRKTWTLYVMRTTKHRTRNRTILSVLRLVGLKYILKSWTDLQISGFKNPIDFPVDSQVSFAATFAACVLAFAREPAFFSTFPELLQRLVSPVFSLSRQLTFVATFVTLSPPLRGLRSDFHERSRVNNERVFWSCSNGFFKVTVLQTNASYAASWSSFSIQSAPNKIWIASTKLDHVWSSSSISSTFCHWPLGCVCSMCFLNVPLVSSDLEH